MREEFKIKVIAKTRQSLVKKISDGDIAYYYWPRPPVPAGGYKPARSDPALTGERRSNKLAEASGRGCPRKESGVVYLIKTKSPREKGRANKEIIDLLARFFNVSQNSIFIKKGAKSNIKTILIIRD